MKQPSLGGGHRNSQYIRRFSHGPLLQLSNLDGLSDRRPQVANRSLEHVLAFRLRVKPLGIRSSVRNNPSLRSRAQITTVIINRVLWVRAFLAENHQRGIDGNPRKPSGEARPTVEILGVKESAQERLLECVFSVLAISGNAIQGF